jgi:hypothetical protein
MGKGEMMRIKSRKLIAVLTVLCAMYSAGAGELPSGIVLEKNGILNANGILFRVIHFGSGYSQKTFSNYDSAQSNTLNRDLSAADGGKLKLALTPLNRDSFTYNAELSFDQKTETLGVMLSALIPASSKIEIPGQNTDFPLPDAKRVDLLYAHCQTVTIELGGGDRLEIKGDLHIKIMDRRSEQRNAFELRLYFTPSKGNLVKSDLKLEFSVKSPYCTTVDLRKAANTGFRDDGHGGWTNQGPSNDMRSMTERRVSVGYVDFEIVNQDENDGRAVIYLGLKSKDKNAVIDLREKGGYLGLLHATAWTKDGKAGEILVEYQDGTTQLIEVESGRDVGNWWIPLQLENGFVAWMGETRKNSIGLYFSQFRLRRDDPVKLTLSGNDSQMWLIAAISLFEKKVDIDSLSKEFITAAGNDWLVLQSHRDIMPGSPLDFSGQLDAPAGKYGRVITDGNGHFTFENKSDSRIRFVGTNLCFTAQFLKKKDADSLAERLARSGYNAVRIHHHDNYLIDPQAADSVTLNQDYLDKLDYLIYALKKRGIYISTDIYTSRKIKAGDGIPEFDPDARSTQPKALLPISSHMRENWKTFARKWLTHRNPYTGMSLLEDPAIFYIGLTNENNIYQWWNMSPRIAARYLELFQQWLSKHHPEEKVSSPPSQSKFFHAFLYELQEQYTMELYNYIKDELKTKALLGDLNMHNKIPLALIRNKLDVVDNHKYHDHPKFPAQSFKYPYSFRQYSAAATLDNEVPGILFAARIFGKAYMITEYKFCAPNRFRMEGGPLIGAYAALQDWDGIFKFAWAHSSRAVNNDNPMSSLDYANDPLARLADQLTMLLFRRNDVAAATDAVGLHVPEDYLESDAPIDCPRKFSQLGFIARIGLLAGDRRVSGVDPISLAQAEGREKLNNKLLEQKRDRMFKTGVAESSSGELVLDTSNGVFTVNTPRSVVIFATTGSHRSGILHADGIDTPTTLAVCSLDGNNLKSSDNILLFHLTDVVDNGIRFQDEDRRIMFNAGKLPHLLRRAEVNVKLAMPGDDPVTVVALKNNGDIYGTVPSTRLPESLEFNVDNSCYPHGVMVYLIKKTSK